MISVVKILRGIREWLVIFSGALLHASWLNPIARIFSRLEWFLKWWKWILLLITAMSIPWKCCRDRLEHFQLTVLRGLLAAVWGLEFLIRILQQWNFFFHLLSFWSHFLFDHIQLQTFIIIFKRIRNYSLLLHFLLLMLLQILNYLSTRPGSLDHLCDIHGRTSSTTTLWRCLI